MKRITSMTALLLLLLLVSCAMATDGTIESTSSQAEGVWESLASSASDDKSATSGSTSSFESVDSTFEDSSQAESVEENSSESGNSSEADESSDAPKDESDTPSGGSSWVPTLPKDYPDLFQFEILPSGYVLYNGAAYSQVYYNASTAPKFAAVYDQYAKLFPSSRISVVTPPTASIVIKDPTVNSQIPDVGKYLDKMEKTIFGNVNFVNLKTLYKQHANEYLFFKSDHHWTHRGAYYAYYGFAKSVGLTPVHIDSLEKKIINPDFNGTLAGFAQDDRILAFRDSVEAYYPTKAHTMRIYYSTDPNNYADFNSSITPSIKNYSCFLTGDQACTYINVPENDQSKSILVIKDSYGNAFIPYLTEHYGKIIVLDPRHIMFDLYEQFKDYGLDDIVFLCNASTNRSLSWCQYYAQYINYNVN